MDIYLHQKHRTIGMLPVEAEQDKNEHIVCYKLLLFIQGNICTTL